MSIDLESMRHIFEDSRQTIVLGKITKISIAQDKSVLFCEVSIFPDNLIIVTRMTWDMVGPECGIFAFPSVNDLVLVALAEKDIEQAFIIKRLTSKEDKIPLQATNGHMVFKSIAGKELWITSDSKILLSIGDTLPTENLVLGQVLKDLLIDILTELSDLSQKVANHTHSGNLGSPTSMPIQSSDFVAISSNFDDLKASPVEDELVLSQLSFTE